MPNALLSPTVVVSTSSIASHDADDVINSNIWFVNALFEDALLSHDEMAQDALRSYYADYLYCQVQNGGFSQFVWNSGWKTQINTLAREGLARMGAVQHLALFDEGADLVAALGAERLGRFFDNDAFGEDPEGDELDTVTNRFFALADHEDLRTLNAAWLRALPDLTVLDVGVMESEIQRIAETVGDRAYRLARARAGAPAYLKVIRALCERAGQDLDHVTAGDPTHRHNGQTTLAWHFITDRGHHHMIEVDGAALMFEADALEPVTELSATVIEQLTAPSQEA